MTIDEAIKVLQEDYDSLGDDEKNTFSGAQLLGIEALKRVKNLRTYPKFRGDSILPGETPERGG